MTRTRSDFERLIAELESDAKVLLVVAAQNHRAWKRIEQGAELIDELRSFRHLFRNLYARTLDPLRTRLVQDKLPPAIAAFGSAHASFVQKLQTIAAGLEA